VLKSPPQVNKYVIPLDTFEADLQYLAENGYNTISANELIAFVYAGIPLPGKPVLLTFDDGYLNNLAYVVPLLQKYNMKAIISVVGEFTERFSENEDHNITYGHFSWTEIAETAAAGCVEIGNHTYFMHKDGARKGSLRKRDEDTATYQKILAEDLTKLQNMLAEKCDLKPEVFAYPYGFIDKDSLEVIRALGFKISLSCEERINIISRDPECLYCLGRYNRPGHMNTEAFMKKALKHPHTTQPLDPARE
jgi:peptidoglycan/xylan/chitin deacetylase (PgdA/CDA1 family)